MSVSRPVSDAPVESEKVLMLARWRSLAMTLLSSDVVRAGDSPFGTVNYSPCILRCRLLRGKGDHIAPCGVTAGPEPTHGVDDAVEDGGR